ncbi:MAG: DUF2723 domain-containing protein [bacterium]
MTLIENRRADSRIATLIFFGFLALFLLTLAPDIMFEDSGEFATSAYSLGVGHPPGYPLYNLLGRAFEALPLLNPAFRINLMSAFFGALGLAALFAAARALGFSRFASFIGAAACGLSVTLWSQAVICEVYTLNTLLIAALLWAMALMRNGSSRALPAFFVLLGLAAAIHYTTLVAFVPALAIAAFWPGAPRKRRFAGFAAGAFLMASMTAIYSLLPFRAAANAIFNWRDPSSLLRFLEHIKRSQFSDWENQLAFHMPTVMKYFTKFMENLPAEYFGVFLFVSLIGIALLISERPWLGAAGAWLWLVQSIGILLYIRFHADAIGFSVARVFYIGAYAVMSVFIAAGTDGLMRHLGAGKPWLRTAIAVALAACLLFPLARGYRQNNLSADNRFVEFDRDIFRYLPRDAVYYLMGAHFIAPAVYLRYTHNLRPDVTLIDGTGNMLISELEKRRGPFKPTNIVASIDQMLDRNNGRFPLVFSQPQPFEGVPWTLAQRGPLFFPAAKPACDLRGWNPASYGFTPESTAGRDFETRALVSFLDTRMAECEFMNGNNAAGLAYVDRSVKSYPDSAQVSLMAGQLLDRYNLSEDATLRYQEALKISPTYIDAFIQLGNQMIEQKQLNAAEVYFKKALAVSPDSLQVKLALANITSLKGDTALALDTYKALLRENPDSVIIMDNLANTYLRTRSIDEARSLFVKALRKEPSSLLTLLDYSGFLLDVGEHDKARALLEKAIKRRPDFAYAHYNLGIALLQQDDFTGAAEHFLRAVEISPKIADAWTNLIIVLLDQNRIKDARDAIILMRETAGLDLNQLTFALYLKTEMKAAESDPQDAEAWRNVILGLLQVKQFDKAYENIKTLKSIAKTPLLKELAVLLEQQADEDSKPTGPIGPRR